VNTARFRERIIHLTCTLELDLRVVKMSKNVSRISVSVPPDLLRRFDEAQKRLGYTDRSKAVQIAMQSFVTESKWLCTQEGNGTGAIVMVYNSAIRQIGDLLMELEREYCGIVESVVHLHLDEKNCLQTISVRGRSEEIKALAEKLMITEGVKEVKLAIVTP